jgi:hypothetical protein
MKDLRDRLGEFHEYRKEQVADLMACFQTEMEGAQEEIRRFVAHRFSSIQT